jgi:LmbE family N-acetylglucosaminyl deacetylase
LIASAALPMFAGFAAARQKVVVAGGHPGDPECGCAGTIARFTDLGHEVVLLYLNRGEGFCGGASLERCATIRTAEAQSACRALSARAAFAGQYDGRAIVDAPHHEACARVLAAEKPDVVFTHWPIDRRRDHRAISLLSARRVVEGREGLRALPLRGCGGRHHVHAFRFVNLQA